MVQAEGIDMKATGLLHDLPAFVDRAMGQIADERRPRWEATAARLLVALSLCAFDVLGAEFVVGALQLLPGQLRRAALACATTEQQRDQAGVERRGGAWAMKAPTDEDVTAMRVILRVGLMRPSASARSYTLTCRCPTSDRHELR